MKDMNSVQNNKIYTDSFSMISALPTDASVTMSYVPFQIDNKTYEADTALMRGTLFPVLDKPFLRGGCK